MLWRGGCLHACPCRSHLMHGPGLRETARSALIAQHTRSGCPGPEQQKYAAAESFLLRGFQGMLEPEGQDLSPRPSITPGLHAGRARKWHRSVMDDFIQFTDPYTRPSIGLNHLPVKSGQVTPFERSRTPNRYQFRSSVGPRPKRDLRPESAIKRNRMLGWNRDAHVYVVRHQMTLYGTVASLEGGRRVRAIGLGAEAAKLCHGRPGG